MKEDFHVERWKAISRAGNFIISLVYYSTWRYVADLTVKKSTCLASRLAESRRHFGSILVAVVANDRSYRPSMRSRNEDDLDDSHPLNYVSHVAYRIEKIPHEHVSLYTVGAGKGRRHRALRINCWKPIEDDKSILFSAYHATLVGRVMEIIRKCRCRLWILWALSNGSHKTIMGSVEWCEEKMEMMGKRVYFVLSRRYASKSDFHYRRKWRWK